MSAAGSLAGHVGVRAACEALGVARATFYRRRRPKTGRRRPRPAPARALGEAERTEVFRVPCSPRFADRAPAEVYATLLDEGVYLCSERTMYRILAENRAVRERRAQRGHPNHPKPEIVARAPNEVWSWDITRLLGPEKWRYFHLYVILDIFSRYVTGWMVADRETAGLGGRLIEEACLKQGVQPRVLTPHSDRGAPMTAKCTAQLLADLGITQSLGRPRVSNDNPYSEAHFKTVKYHPGFPGRFGGIEEAKDFCRTFFPWYNTEHRHGGIGLLTPEQVHLGRAPAVIEHRRNVLAAAYAARPDRFVAPGREPAVRVAVPSDGGPRAGGWRRLRGTAGGGAGPPVGPREGADAIGAFRKMSKYTDRSIRRSRPERNVSVSEQALRESSRANRRAPGPAGPRPPAPGHGPPGGLGPPPRGAGGQLEPVPRLSQLQLHLLLGGLAAVDHVVLHAHHRQGWLVFDMTGSPFLVTAVAASSQLPSLVLSIFGGVIADRFNRKAI